MELSDKSLNINKLQLRKIVKLELFSIGLVNSGDSAFNEASNIESETEQTTSATEGPVSLSRNRRKKKKHVKSKKIAGSSSRYCFSDSSSGSASVI